MFRLFGRKKTKENGTSYSAFVYDKSERALRSISRVTKEEAMEFLKRNAEVNSGELSLLERGADAFGMVKVIIAKTGLMVKLTKVEK